MNPFNPICSDNHGEPQTPCNLPIPEELKSEWAALQNRRHFLGNGGKTLALAGLASLLGDRFIGNAAAANAGGSAADDGFPHFPGTAKRVISLFMSGGPPQMETLDYKPELAKWNGKDLPSSVRPNSTGMTSGQARFPVAASNWGFKQYGQSGRWISDLLPYTGKLADDITVINSMHTDAINHEPATLQFNTGNMVPGKPSMGAWLSYGLGSLNENLPSYVVLTTKNTVGNAQPITSRLWGSGFLSSSYAGVQLRAAKDPVLYLRDPKGMDRGTRRDLLDAVNEMNRKTYEEFGDAETHSRISQYEMAFRMQTSVPELSDLSDEPASTWALYGEEAKIAGTYAYNCLMARRLAERGVRCTQVYKRGWDVHANLKKDLPILCREVDRANYALVTDLKRRGMLDDTLVMWNGEFGRTVYSQGTKADGRDHHADCFSMWMAGGGVKEGTVYGKTDDFSSSVVENPVHTGDLSATILHALGIEHEKLSFRFGGLDQRLTGVEHRKVIKAILKA